MASTSPLTLAILCGSQYSTGTAVLTEEELDWLQSGVVHPCARPAPKGRPLVSKRQVKRREGREGRLFHLSHWPPRSTRTSTHTCRFSGVSGLLCPRLSKWSSSVRKNSDARPSSPPFQDRVDVAVRHRQRRAGADSTLHEPAHREEVYETGGEADQTSRVWMSCAPPRGRFWALNVWHRLRKTVNRELHALTGNTSSFASAPILPVHGSDSARPTFRTRISRQRTLDVLEHQRSLRGQAKKDTVADRTL